MPRKSRTSLALLECLLLGLFVGFVAYQVGIRRGAALERASGYPDDPALEPALRAKYGPDHHSAGMEEWIVRDFFREMRGGVFADIGAWEWQADNNTVALEQALGWSGLAVDAVPTYAEDWRRHRPRTRFIVAFVDRAGGEPRTIDVPVNASQVASDQTNTAMHTTSAYQGKTVQVRTMSATLDALLESAGITRLDYLSMDIELHEPAGLAGFSIERFRPKLVCIEAHPPVRQQILDYFHQHGYVVVGQYLRLDSTNLWFKPA
jgi:hypothetical protein